METVGNNWLKLFEILNESQQRWLAGLLALEIGRGGVTEVSNAFKISNTTTIKGKKEINQFDKLPTDRIRAGGGGRKHSHDNKLLMANLERILDESTGGDPMNSIQWTCKSVRTIAEELTENGFTIDHTTVYKLIKEMGYSLQVNKKALSRENNPNRDQ